MSERAPRRYSDGSLSFEGGIDSGKAPSLIGKNQSAFAVNTTFREAFASPRPGFIQKTNIASGRFQCATPYISDEGRSFIIIKIDGEIWSYDVELDSAINLSLQSGVSHAANISESWMVQAENYVVIQDGSSKPIIFDGSSIRFSKDDELKTGRNMAYVNGRIWYALPDGFSFRATDIVYGDGSRSSVLKETENTFLNEGGDFAVPSDSGGITAMAVPGNLDTALGQGPLLVFTPRYVFSINAPVDRTIWKDINYPIQAISLVTNGALADRSTITINGDVFYRSIDGIRSFVVARRDFGTWGNTPVSSEMLRVIDGDTDSLLNYSSAVCFDNRMLMTCNPQWGQSQCIHKALAVMDFDLVTSIREKLPPAWEGVWTGLDILQILKTQNVSGERCFIISSSGENGEDIGIWELSKSGTEDVGLSQTTSIQWAFETRSYNFDTPFGLKRLDSGDLFIDRLSGTVDFSIKYRPDQYPGWIDWNSWSECATVGPCETPFPCVPLNRKPQYRTKMRLPTPSDECDEAIGTQFRNMFEVQVRFAAEGYCRVKSIRVHAYDVQEQTVGQCLTDSACKSIEACDIDPYTYSLN
jgi:hypothetical protein